MGMNPRIIRQHDLVDESILDTPILVIGAGGIGSFTVLTLAKMGFSDITVYDDDVVSEENMNSQFYRYTDIGKSKVLSLWDLVYSFTDIEIKFHPEKYVDSMVDKHEHLRDTEVIISAVDSMEARSMIYSTREDLMQSYLLIDGRMAANQAEVYTVDLMDEQSRMNYEAKLWRDEETMDVPCTAKAVMYNVLWIASAISNQVRLALTEKPYHPMQIMDLENMYLFQPIPNEAVAI